VDVADLGRAVDAGRLAAARGDVDAAAAQFTRALDLYAGDLLPEEGPAEWVVKARERLRLDAAEAAQGLATIELERGRAAAAASVGERGLQIDRFRDGLWRLVIDAHEQSGDAAAAARARRGYDEVLTELGVRT
jgi:DNA-binding SARP family transcriptional activator